MDFAAWRGATGCSGRARPGAVALAAAFVEAYGEDGLTSLGVYNCRKVAGSTTWSVHADGRAVDLGVSSIRETDVPLMVLATLRSMGDLTLQRIIYAGHIYDAETPAGRGTGSGNPHIDHIHVELSLAAADGLIPLELELDEGDDMLTAKDVEDAVRRVLDEGKPHGAVDGWRGGNAAAIALDQGDHNLLARLEAAVARLEARAP